MTISQDLKFFCLCQVQLYSLRNQAVNSPENVEKNNPGYDQNPQFSPDGKYIAWQSMARDGYESDRNRLCVYNIATGEKKYVTETFDSNVDGFCWMNDSETISFIGVWHGCVNEIGRAHV